MVRTMKWATYLLFTACTMSIAKVTAELGDSNYGSKKSSAESWRRRRNAKFNPVHVGDMTWSDSNVALLATTGIVDPAKEMQISETTSMSWNSTTYIDNVTVSPSECGTPSIEEFPWDGFSDSQRKSGWLVLHVVLLVYACYALAIVCDAYFIPSLELISARLGLSRDVAGATFMAAGTSAPEMFESLIGTFVTHGDIGVGTIVGSAVFNVLAVTAGCGLLAGMVVPLDWYPLTRDSVCYGIIVLVLIAFVHDERIYWYESAILLSMFGLYILMMVKNRKLEKIVRRLIGRTQTNDSTVESLSQDSGISHESSDRPKKTYQPVPTETTHLDSEHQEKETETESLECRKEGYLAVPVEKSIDEKHDTEDDDDDDVWSPCTIPKHTFCGILYYVICWPANFLFYVTIPNCKKDRWKRFYVFTFLISVFYIGWVAYFIAWMVTIMGYTFRVPDTVMGMTFLAIGTSTPEGFSSIIVSRKGYGNMAISNSVGSNAFDILFCLSIPWLIKAIFYPMPTLDGSSGHYVKINSNGLVYSVTALLVLTLLMYVTIAVHKFKMNKKVGSICLVFYLLFLSFATLVEMNFFGRVNPDCS